MKVRRHATMLVLVIAVVAVAACSSSSSPSGASPGGDDGGALPASDAGGSPPEAAPASGGVSVIGEVADGSNLTAASNFDVTKYSGLTGVEVCVYGDTSVPCVTTDASGNYTLAAPAGTAFTASYTKAGYQPILYAIAAAAEGGRVAAPAIFLTTTSSFDSFGTMGGATPDTTKGTILFGAGTVGPSAGAIYHEMFGAIDYYYIGGYTVTITPAATVGPVYVSASWEPNPSLTAASDAGWGFFQLPPGNYTLSFTSPTLSCGTTTATVVAGYVTTYVGVACSPGAGTPVGDASTDGSTPVTDASTDGSTPVTDASADGG